jgi:hypothetical protein
LSIQAAASSADAVVVAVGPDVVVVPLEVLFESPQAATDSAVAATAAMTSVRLIAYSLP